MPPRNRPPLRLAAALVLVALLAAAGGIAAQEKVTASAADPELHVKALSVEVGGEFKVTSFRLEGDTRGSELDLERFEVFAPDVVIEVQSAVDAPPQQIKSPATSAAYFRGTISGVNGSAAMLAVHEDGRVSGMAFRGNDTWAVGKEGQSAPAAGIDGPPPAVDWTEVPLTSKRAPNLAQNTRRPFTCGNKVTNFGGLGDRSADEPEVKRKLLQSVVDQRLQATVAFETDGEFWNVFKDQDKAVSYIGSMMGYSDLVYSREIGVDMVVGYIKLWNGGPNSDPWPYSDDTGMLLDTFGEYWNKNMQDVPRTVAHFLSGMDNGGGVAWVGVLCDYYRSKSNNNGYGYTGSIVGDFSWDGIQGSNPRAVVWDISSVMHEIGHNFNSPHTHDYCGIGGNSNPVDSCVSGCKGSGGLPSCSARTPYFNGGSGTIMSYCHMQRGGDNNVAMTFGQGHTCGIAPERVPERMKSHVASMASRYPQCFKSAAAPAAPTPSPPPQVVPSPPPKAVPSPPPKAVPSPPPPKAASQGSWGSPIPIDKLPFLGEELRSFQSGTAPPITCNFLSNNRPVVVYRWFSGSMAGGNLTLSSCANINTNGDAVVTVLSSPNAANGPWTCVGGDDDGCGVSGGAFSMAIGIAPQTHYFIAVAPYSSFVPPMLRLSASAQPAVAAPSPPTPTVPSPPPPTTGGASGPTAPTAPTGPVDPATGPGANGTWTAPVIIPSVPFLSEQLTTFPQGASWPLPCGYFEANRPMTVYRWFANATLGGAKVTVSSCGLTSTGGDNVVTVLASANAADGPWTCIGGNDDGCGEGTDGPFDMSFMAQANTHYFFAASPFAAATPIAFRLNVTARLQPPPVVPASPSPPPPAVVPSPSPPPPPVVPQQPASGTGSWSSPITITSLPFTSADLATFSPSKAPLWCGGLRKNVDYPVVVFRWFATDAWARGSLTASSCGATARGDPVVTVLATADPNASRAVWNCVGGNDDGCGRGSSAFNVKVPTLTANRWYYIVVAPYSATGTTPKLRLTVSGQKRS